MSHAPARMLDVAAPLFVAGQRLTLAQGQHVVAALDGRESIDSRGTIIWREFIGSSVFSSQDLIRRGALFDDDFDVENPVYTPGALAVSGGNKHILQALARAVMMLDSANIELGTTLGEVQYRIRGETKVPVSGGPYFSGVIAVASYAGGGNTTLLERPKREAVLNRTTGLTTDGYPINNGNSWVMVISLANWPDLDNPSRGVCPAS